MGHILHRSIGFAPAVICAAMQHGSGMPPREAIASFIASSCALSAVCALGMPSVLSL